MLRSASSLVVVVAALSLVAAGGARTTVAVSGHDWTRFGWDARRSSDDPTCLRVTFTTSLRRYPELDEDYFEAAADLSLWQNNGYSALPVKLTRSPGFCKIVKIEPQNIDFIVHK